MTQPAPISPTPEWLSARQLAAYLDIHVSNAYRLKAYIPHVKRPGVGLRFRKRDVDNWLEDGLRFPLGKSPGPTMTEEDEQLKALVGF